MEPKKYYEYLGSEPSATSHDTTNNLQMTVLDSRGVKRFTAYVQPNGSFSVFTDKNNNNLPDRDENVLVFADGDAFADYLNQTLGAKDLPAGSIYLEKPEKKR